MTFGGIVMTSEMKKSFVITKKRLVIQSDCINITCVRMDTLLYFINQLFNDTANRYKTMFNRFAYLIFRK